MNTLLKSAELLTKVRELKPLVHHITNYVTVNDCANVTLAVGASPVMADDIAEVTDIVSISSAVVLNIGTLNQRTIQSMISAGGHANKIGVPVVLDPVGVGASVLRNETVEKIVSQVKCSVIRGNISEIRYLAGISSVTKGVDASEVDALDNSVSKVEIAQLVAKKYNCVVAITGAIDILSDGARTISISNGREFLGSITGTGCMCTSLIGSFCGVTSDYLIAATSGILCMGICAELVFDYVGQNQLGSYRVAMMDEISNLSVEILQTKGRVDESIC